MQKEKRAQKTFWPNGDQVAPNRNESYPSAGEVAIEFLLVLSYRMIYAI
jgi:hypothetical protein